MGLIDELHRSRRLSGNPLTSIHVTHNLQFARRADRIVKLEQGKLIETALSSGGFSGEGSSGDVGQGKNYV
jgi:ABC-type bacteriocin/lantibiotic exporter with double-glycine peptidase domain